MSWTDDTWAAFAAVLRRGFAAKDPFTADDERVYRLLLDGVEPDHALRAVRELVLEGQALRPRPGEIVARCRRDTGAPTFAEAYRLLFGAGGALHASPPRGGSWGSEAERRRQRNDAIRQRASEMHPLIGAFLERQGIDRLLSLGVNDPEWGEARRRELERAWDAHADAFDGREVAALAAGQRGSGELARLDPLRALGLTENRSQLTAATTEVAA